MKMTTLVSLLVFSYFLAACGKSDSLETNSNVIRKIEEDTVILDVPRGTDRPSVESVPVGLVSRKTILESDLSNLDEFSNNINSYAFELKNAPADWEGEFLQCVNQKAEESKPLLASISNGQAHINLDSSKSLKTVYECFVEGKKLFPKFELLKGFVIDSEIELSVLLGAVEGQYDLGPIVMKPSARLYVRDTHFVLKTSLLVISSDHSIPEIDTFKSTELTAADGFSGRPGGNLTMNVDKVLGSVLRVNMFGQNGGEQKALPPMPAQPEQARACQARKACHEVTRCRDMDRTLEDSGLSEINSRPDIPRGGCSTTTVCETVYDAPSRGWDAKMGEKGFDGTSGGASGRFTLNVQAENNLKDLVIKIAGGKKGLGGKGGAPSLPGLGGDCPTGRGASGNSAKPGEPGRDGEDGRSELSCITQALQNHQSCFSEGRG